MEKLNVKSDMKNGNIWIATLSPNFEKN